MTALFLTCTLRVHDNDTLVASADMPGLPVAQSLTPTSIQTYSIGYLPCLRKGA